jgi:hypothetical protein
MAMCCGTDDILTTRGLDPEAAGRRGTGGETGRARDGVARRFRRALSRRVAQRIDRVAGSLNALTVSSCIADAYLS